VTPGPHPPNTWYLDRPAKPEHAAVGEWQDGGVSLSGAAACALAHCVHV